MPVREIICLTLADLLLLVHFLFVLFVVLGLALVWIGYLANWGWIRNMYFRLAHLAAIGFVAAEAILGVICPLTVWENQLRQSAGAGPAYETTFMQHWLHQVLFFDLPERVFVIAYVVFLTATAASWWWVRPRGFTR